MSTKKKTAPKDDGRELAFRLYFDMGEWDAKALSELLKERYGIEVKETGLNAWRDAGDWDGRVRRIEARSVGDGRNGRSYEQIMFDSLLERKEAYDRFFDTQGANIMDNNAQWAYNDIISKLMSLLGAMNAAELKDLAPEEAKQRLSELFNSAYGLRACK